MKISYNWLKDYIEIDKPAEEVAAILTGTGLEVEKILDYRPVKSDLEGIIVGKVLEVKKHPNADKLSVTLVDLGQGDPVQIVCGAPNVAEGQKVPVATIGTKLVTYDGQEIKMKKGKIRGEVSMGMILAEDEIGLSDNHDGIMVLDEDAPVGKSVKEVLDLPEDKVFEIGLTPNRADAMSHFGVARDLYAKLNFEGEKMHFSQRSVGKFTPDNRVQPVQIEIKDGKKCARYVGLVIKNVKVEESPEWLQQRLRAIGLIPRNNIVDITNYVMHDIGQPMHAFDLSKIKGNKVIVRTAKEGEKIVALDDKEYELSAEDLVIANQEEPMAIAGVIGGKDSAISDTTTDILLESAYFDPVSVRKTAKKLGIATDSSFRFERGIDPEITDFAIKYAALLIKEVLPDAIITEPADEIAQHFQPVTISLSYEYLNRMIGEVISPEKIKEILALLDFQIVSSNEENLAVQVPLYRVDVTRPADVVEEILRIYGYDTVPVPSKMNFSIAHEEAITPLKLENETANLLTHSGFNETMSVSMTSGKQFDVLHSTDKEKAVELLNPVSADYAYMRQSLLISGLENLQYNFNRQREDLAIFEFGNIYFKEDGKYVEKRRMGIFLTGNLLPENWIEPLKKSGFFHLKGQLEKILERWGVSYEEQAFEHGDLSDAVVMKVKDQVLAVAGIVKPSIAKTFDIKKPVYFGEIDMDYLFRYLKKQKPSKIKPIPKFPAMRRDLALVVDKDVSYAKLYDIARKTEKKLLESVNLFDVYEGEKIGEGKKSYAVSFVFRSPDKTLKDKQVDKIMKRLLTAFEQEAGAKLRS